MKAFAYYRVISEQQRQKQSIKLQKIRLKKYAAGNLACRSIAPMARCGIIINAERLIRGSAILELVH